MRCDEAIKVEHELVFQKEALPLSAFIQYTVYEQHGQTNDKPHSHEPGKQRRFVVHWVLGLGIGLGSHNVRNGVLIVVAAINRAPPPGFGALILPFS